jgi:glycine dehydrogenase subunit 1
VLLSSGLHPEYRHVVRSYLSGYGRGTVEEVPLGADGRTDLDALAGMLDEQVAVVALGYPNFYGVIEDLRVTSERVHKSGALAVSATTEALSLALLASPGSCGIDIAVAEGQSLGLSMSYGGPGVGFFATRAAHVRQMPGRLVGETLDDRGRRGYVLTLSTREQHIRREKATSNICTNQGLAALAVTAYLGVTGRRGLRALAIENARRAHDTARKIEADTGLSPVFSAPFFNEFTIPEPRTAGWFDAAVASGVVPGVRLQRLCDDTAAKGRLLVTVTECTTPDDVAALTAALGGGQHAKKARA